MAKKLRLGELLLKDHIITQEQLEIALEEQKKSGGKKIGQVFVNLGYVTEKDLLIFLSEQLNVPKYDLTREEINFTVASELPESYARRFNAILLHKTPDQAVVGVADPLDLTAIDELKRHLNCELDLVIVAPSDLLRMQDLIYRHQAKISRFAKSLEAQLSSGNRREGEDRRKGDRRQATEAQEKEAAAPVVKLLESLFEDAVQVGASDIHIEPDRNVLRIRLRINGVLYEQIIKQKSIAEALASRLKLVANLNIAEKRLPQDGRFTVKVRDRVVDVRFSTLPTQYGESLVMRLLDQSAGILNLEKIGMDAEILAHFRRLVHHPNALILVTGPTGSGKSTTLYAALEELNLPDRKIITVEDPVEYRLPRVNQVQVHNKVGLTFVRVLKTALRQDPDIILIGEMRDEETARVGMQASLTGHLVLSTLHTNDSASTALRLMDMGIEGYLVASTLRGVLAQRLVRHVCETCKEQYEPSQREKDWLAAMAKKITIEPIDKFYAGKGCMYCNHTGFNGRVGVFELLELTPEMMTALSKKDLTAFSALANESLQGQLLLDNALRLVSKGITTIEEVIKMHGES